MELIENSVGEAVTTIITAPQHWHAWALLTAVLVALVSGFALASGGKGRNER